MNKYLKNKKYKQKAFNKAKILIKKTGWYKESHFQRFFYGFQKGFNKFDRQFLHDNKSGFSKITRSHKKYNQKILKKCYLDEFQDEKFEYKYKYCQLYYW